MRLGHVVRICETHIFVIHTYILTYMSHSLTFMSHVSMRLTHYRSLLRKNPVKDIYVSRICETHICVCHKYASLTVSHICLTYLWGSHMCETHMYVSPGSECAFHTDINRAYCTYVWDCTLTCLWVLEVNVHFIMGHMVHMCETAHTHVRESRKCTLTYMWVLEVNVHLIHMHGVYGTYVWDCTHTYMWVLEVNVHTHICESWKWMCTQECVVLLSRTWLCHISYVWMRCVTHMSKSWHTYGVAMISRLLKHTGLFCRISSIL